jgi:Flp pilus assembly protein TadG
MDTKSAMLRFKTRSKETGQALVLIAMLVVILLAFLGLAIDGGGMFLLWRDAQNAVDTAALQAAFSYCTSNKDFQAAIDAGTTAAKDNGFDNNMIDNWVTVVPAPADRRPSNLYISDTNAVMLVTIRAVKPAYFIQLVYGGPLEVTVDTVGICSPATDSVYEGYAMFSMGSNGLCGWDADDANSAHAQTALNGSDQHYFGPWFTNGNASVGGGGGGIKFYDDAGIDFVGGLNGLPGPKVSTDDGDPLVTNNIPEVTAFPPLYEIEEFMPGGQYYAEAAAQGKAYLLSGSSATIDGSGASPLEGLYVMPTGDLKVKNNATIGMGGVTLVASGEISVGGVDGSISGEAWQPYVAGVTAFSLYDEANPDCNVSGGGAAISFSNHQIIGFGILYAPNSGITMSGSDSAWCGALIANAIDRTGSNTWIFGQVIPDEATLLEYVEDGLNEDFVTFHDRSCDYINNDTPPFYGLGD